MVSRRRHLLLGYNALAALNAANAWHPFSRFTPLSVPCFDAGWPTTELPLQMLGAHAAVNAAAVRAGHARGASGRAGLALGAAAAAGLVALHRIGRAADDAYEQALVDALGPDYRDEIVQPEYPGPGAADSRAPGVVRMLRIRRRFARDRNLRYGPDHANVLDVWRREDLPPGAQAPVLLQMPGGAWVIGNKQAQGYPLMSHLAERGWVCVAISYRLAPWHRWPAQIVDVKRALAWIRTNIARFGGDPGFVAVTGGSAGGHLCSLAALTPNDPEFQPGFEQVDTSVAAAAPFYGAYDWTDTEHVGHHSLVRFVERFVVGTTHARDPGVFDRASPMHRIHPGAPPFLVSHGTSDSLIPVEQGRLFAQRLASVSRQPVAYAEIPHAQHSFDLLGSVRGNLAAEAAARFLGVAYGRYRAAVAEAGVPPR